MATTLTEGESDYASKVGELAEMLNTDAVSLSESVLESVAKVLEAEDKRFKLSNEKSMKTTSVLGKELRAAGIELDEVPGETARGLTMNKDAWDAFLRNEIDFTAPVDLATKGAFKGHGAEVASMPKFKDPMAAHVYKLRAVAEKCRDDSMANLLGFIAEHRPVNRNKALAQIMDVIANKAFKIAGIDQVKSESEVANAPAVVEFEQWVNSHNSQALAEYDRFEQPSGDEFGHEDTLNDIVKSFDYNEFMSSPEAEEFMHDQLGALSDEEKQVSKDQVVSAIENFLSNKLADASFTGAHTRDDAEHVFDMVVGPALQEDGYTVDDSGASQLPMAAEDAGMETAELSQEDVLIPTNQANDLEGEVTPATVRDPSTGNDMEPDQGYINRLTALAGMKK